MRKFVRNLADVFDGLAVLAGAVAIGFLFISLPLVEGAVGVIQVAALAIMIAAVPYCMAGALHRIWLRISSGG
jgi:hypothetical protein